MQRFPEILGAVERPRVVLRVLSSAGAAADASDDDRAPPADASASDGSDDDRPAPRAAGRFDEFAFREAVPESVGAMRSLITSAGLSSADCVEKSELRARSALALERLAEAKRLRDARNE